MPKKRRTPTLLQLTTLRKPQPCPYCGKALDKHTTPGPKRELPARGDITICAHCLGVCKYGGKRGVELLQLGAGEWAALTEAEQSQIARLRSSLRMAMRKVFGSGTPPEPGEKS